MIISAITRSCRSPPARHRRSPRPGRRIRIAADASAISPTSPASAPPSAASPENGPARYQLAFRSGVVITPASLTTQPEIVSAAFTIQLVTWSMIPVAAAPASLPPRCVPTAPSAWRAGLQCENGLTVFRIVQPTLHPPLFTGCAGSIKRGDRGAVRRRRTTGRRGMGARRYQHERTSASAPACSLAPVPRSLHAPVAHRREPVELRIECRGGAVAGAELRKHRRSGRRRGQRAQRAPPRHSPAPHTRSTRPSAHTWQGACPGPAERSGPPKA